MTGERRLSWWRWLRWPLALAVLGWLVLPNLKGLQSLVAEGVAWQWLMAAAGLRFFALVLTGFRWKLMLGGQGIHPSGSRVARIVGVGYVCNFVLPGTIGGDVAKAGLIAADAPESRTRALATVPLDRGLGLLAFVMLGAIAGLCQWTTITSDVLRTAVLLMAGISVVGLVGLVIGLFGRLPRRWTEPVAEEEDESRLRRIVRELLHGREVLRQSRRIVVVALLLGMVGHVGVCSAMYCCLRTFPAAESSATWSDHLWLVPSAEVPAAFLSMPGGLGAREGALSYFYGQLAVAPEQIDAYRNTGLIVGGSFSLVCLGLAVLIGLALLVSPDRVAR